MLIAWCKNAKWLTFVCLSGWIMRQKTWILSRKSMVLESLKGAFESISRPLLERKRQSNIF